MTHTPNTYINSVSTPSPAEADELRANLEPQIAQRTLDCQDQKLIQQMVECLGDTRGLVRLYYAETLGKIIGQPAVEPLIEALLNHPNVVVRRAAGKTLTLIEDPQAIPHLIYALLHDEDTVVQASAIGALARMGEAAVDPLLDILASADSTESNKGHAAWALAFIGAPAKERLFAVYHSDSPEVRAAVVGAIAKVAEENPQDTKALNLLVESLNDSAVNVRSEAAAVIGNLKHQPAIPILVQLLNHPEAETRKSSALSLMKIGDRSALDSLQIALAKEPEAGAKKAIALAISLLTRQTESDW
jgi:bilin biosynthesis protein